MRTLLVMRHGKSSWSDPMKSDHDRPLKKRGRRDAPLMGSHLDQQDLVPGLVMTSTAVRARSTAELVSQEWLDTVAVVACPDLYGGAPDDYVESLAETDPDALIVMVVGHNPGLEMLVAQLSGVHTRLPTAAVAVVDLPLASWSDLQEHGEGELRAVWRPRELWS